MSKRSPHERSDMRVYLDQARTRSGTTIPHVAPLMRATLAIAITAWTPTPSSTRPKASPRARHRKMAV